MDQAGDHAVTLGFKAVAVLTPTLQDGESSTLRRTHTSPAKWFSCRDMHVTLHLYYIIA